MLISTMHLHYIILCYRKYNTAAEVRSSVFKDTALVKQLVKFWLAL